jgi:hypothetical protein
MGLGIPRLSLVCAVCNDTGDDGEDAVVKVRRVINRRGKQFCNITNWPFLRSDLTFNITSAGGYYYSGASYLPTTFKKVLSAYLVDGTTHIPLTEDGIVEKYNWPNPDDNEGRPDKFCITRIESGYWQIAFNRKPDNTYAVYLEIELQWTDLTGDTSETVITKDYEEAFIHYCDMGRFLQQGDTENYSIYKIDWDGNNPRDIPRHSILGQLLAGLSSPSKKKQVVGHDFSESGLKTTYDYKE